MLAVPYDSPSLLLDVLLRIRDVHHAAAERKSALHRIGNPTATNLRSVAFFADDEAI
jgi:hypothetical protein